MFFFNIKNDVYVFIIKYVVMLKEYRMVFLCKLFFMVKLFFCMKLLLLCYMWNSKVFIFFVRILICYY